MEFLKQMDAENRLQEVAVLVRDTKKNRRKLKQFGSTFSIYWGDITNYEHVLNAVVGKDLVIHLAALIPTVETNEAIVNRVNIGGTENIVRAMESQCPDAFLLFSSSLAIYGDRIKDPYIKIGDPLTGVEHDNYSRTKVEAEKIIQQSKLNWSIFRLSAIMGIGNHKISGIMFEVPLETPFEIATVRDTARAFVNSIPKTNELNHRIFNLSGGESCRILYSDFLSNAFEAFGMGKPNFPEYAFARQNFHCGYFLDGDVLEEILQFRSDTIESYFQRFRASVPGIQRIVTIPFAPIVKKYLSTLSEPLQAFKKKDKEKIEFFFGKIEA